MRTWKQHGSSLDLNPNKEWDPNDFHKCKVEIVILAISLFIPPIPPTYYLGKSPTFIRYILGGGGVRGLQQGERRRRLKSHSSKAELHCKAQKPTHFHFIKESTILYVRSYAFLVMFISFKNNDYSHLHSGIVTVL